MTVENVVFLAILGLAVGLFSYNMQRLVRYMTAVGHAENRTDHPGTRLRNLLSIGILQTKILRDRTAGPLHAFVFWGFLVLGAGTAEIMLRGLWTPFSYALILPRPLYLLYLFSQEAFGVFAVFLPPAVSASARRGMHEATHAWHAI